MEAAYTLEDLRRIVSPVCEKYDLAAAYVFGSCARGDATPSSDVDILIDREGSKVETFFDIGGVYSDLEDSLNSSIDLITVQALEPRDRDDEWDIALRNNIMNERVKLYERK